MMEDSLKSKSNSSNNKNWAQERKSPMKEISIFNEVFKNEEKKNFDDDEDHRLKEVIVPKLPKLFKTDHVESNNPKQNPKQSKRKKRDKVYKCSECGKSFNEKGNLTVHMRIHTGERPFNCSHCNMAFKTKGQLDNHRNTHTGKKPFKCDECGKELTRLASLKTHKFIHMKVHPYGCPLCEKFFRDKGNLKKHVKSKHLNMKSKKIQIMKCDSKKKGSK